MFLNGKLKPGVFAKDVILLHIKELTVNGATNKIIEFTGPIVDEMSMEAGIIICNMAIEAGATCGVCYPDMTTVNIWVYVKEDKSESKEAALKEYSKWISDEGANYEKVYDLIYQDSSNGYFRLQTGSG